MQRVKDKYGPECVAFYVAYTKEPRPYYQRLTHAFGSPNYCTESSNCFSATWLADVLTYGIDYAGLGFQSYTLDPATKCKIIWGNTVENSMPRFWEEHTEARRKGLKLIVADPRRTNIASMADIHLQARPGTDGALALGMINVIISEQLYNKDFIQNWTVGFDDLKEMVWEYSPERVEQITWVPAFKIREAAILYATNKPAKIGMSACATTHHSNGVQSHRAIILLPALTGNFDVPGGNQMLPDPVPTSDITLHERIADMPPGLGTDRFPIWTKLNREMQSNVIADRIENGKPYPIKALFGAGLNLMFFPNSNRFAEVLKRLDFLVITEYFQTPATQFADIVLPIASWLERRCLVAPPFSAGLASLVEPSIKPLSESRPEVEIIFELADKLGLKCEFWNGDFEKGISDILEPSGITLQDLKHHPEGIPFLQPHRPARYYEKDGFKTPSGKVEVASSILAEHGHEPLPVYREPAESPVSRPDLAKSFPLVLTSGARTLAFTHSQFRNIAQLRKMVPEPLVDINPADAKPRRIKSGDIATVSSPRGEIKLKANVTDIILPGVVHVPHQWSGEANVNILVDDQNLDPISGFAPFKSQLCQVTKEGI